MDRHKKSLQFSIGKLSKDYKMITVLTMHTGPPFSIFTVTQIFISRTVIYKYLVVVSYSDLNLWMN